MIQIYLGGMIYEFLDCRISYNSCSVNSQLSLNRGKYCGTFITKIFSSLVYFVKTVTNDKNMDKYKKKTTQFAIDFGYYMHVFFE